MVRVQSLHVYPVKGCAGLAVPRLTLDRRGPLHDRRWMVVDGAGRFVTQRECPRLALVRVAIDDERLVLEAEGLGRVGVPLGQAGGGASRRVVCWAAECDAVDEGREAADFLSEWLGREASLVRMADDFDRVVNPLRSPERAVTGFTDGYPFLIVGEASLRDLNQRLDDPLPMDRFRPNVVVGGTPPYQEDRWRRIRVGEVPLDVVKPCSRCAVTVTDQQTGARGKEPLSTLARYRRREGEVFFGQNAVHRSTGTLAVGDAVEVLEEGGPPVFE